MDGGESGILPPRSHRRRGRGRVLGITVGLLAVLVLAVAFLAWAGLALTTAYREAQGARTALTAAQEQIVAGDTAPATANLASAEAALARADAAARALPLKVLARVPWVGTTVHDLRYLIAGAAAVTAGAQDLAGALDTVRDPADGSNALFPPGGIDLTVLADVGADVTAATTQFGAAVDLLTAVDGSGPVGDVIVEARDAALPGAVDLRDTLVRADAVLPILPDALGAEGTRRYLVTLLNSGELHASGGTALAAATVTLEDGRVTLQRTDITGSDIAVSGGRTVRYPHRSTLFGGPTSRGPVAFAWATLDPDFRVSGYELAESWEATTGQEVDGVIALDANGIAALLRGTGPIDGGTMGELTGDNFVQKVLIDAYRDAGFDQTERKALNRRIFERMAQDLAAGSTAWAMVESLGAAVPGRHVQAWFADEDLQQAAVTAGLSGQVEAGPGDHIAVFTENWNNTKNDVFQRRQVTQRVRLAADGSAQVERTTAITWDTPDYARTDRYFECYVACWSFAYLLGYRPVTADLTDMAMTSTSAAPPRRLLAEPRRYELDDQVILDSFGRPMVRTGAWVAPDGTATQTVRYLLPAGTFSQPDGSVRYEVQVDPQPFVGTAQATIEVIPPAGWTRAAGSALSATVPMDEATDWSATVIPAP